MDVYKDQSQSYEKRCADLLQRMTLEEKVGQMMQLPANFDNNMDKLESMNIGSYLHCTGDMMRELQTRAEKTRLGIPLIFGIDAIHGHCFDNRATVFPTQLGVSCSWNRDLIREMGAVTAREVRANGIHWTFSPVLCVGRDARWGRVDETFGEDPWLIGEMAAEMVEGYQGKEGFANWEKILACGKHYAAYGEADGGRDAYEADVSRRNMLTYFLPPFEKIVKDGCATLMAGYQAINGEPCSASRWLLRDQAKESWDLDGFIVTDWDNIGSLHTKQKVAEDLKEAAYIAVTAGNDMIMTTPSFYKHTIELVKEGRLDESMINDSVRRILMAKFRLGLFDEYRHTSPEREAAALGREDHWEAAAQASRESLVLLKNEGILPLKPGAVKTITLVGANADDVVAQLGDWSFGSMQAGASDDSFHRDVTVTLLAGLKERAEREGITVNFVKGADPLDENLDECDQAAAAAREADLTVACVGDTLKLHGEFHDRANLDLTGKQQKLLEAVKAAGTPLCVVLLASKPLTVPWIKENADALVCAFNPGAKAGEGIAEVLFGDLNPMGKLTISFPHHAGQIPVHYNRFSGWHSMNDPAMPGEERYIDMPEEPLFVFGEGMGFSPFSYADLKVSKSVLQQGEDLEVSVSVKNEGDYDGWEIVQLYINDQFSSLTTPVKELRGFKRVYIRSGETVTVDLTLPFEELSLINADLQRVVEPGRFDIMVGASSRDEDLLKTVIRVE
ncbi:MAG: glycoside hydrolase family 3 N-terminal domain-containing protein [Spirochaetales bacterium]|nr:glycoside hydrolase family 3 N-terminal domain-containing protein [Spirochaetales bacterium]